MKNKILVRLYVPTIEAEYDLWLPLNKRIYVIIKLLIKVIYEFNDGYYLPKKMPLLYDRKTCSLYDVNAKVIDTDIRNGSELILI